MYLGFYLGKIFSPIVLGSIFIIFFIPISLIKKLLNNDELRINIKKQKSYWLDKKQVEINHKWFKNIF